MGLLNNIGRGAVGWSTGGLSELGRKDPFGFGSGSGPSGPAPWNPITAENTAIPAGLTAAFGNVGNTAKAGVGSIYGGLRARSAADARGPMVKSGPGSYADQRFGTQQGLDTGNLEASLGGELGKGAYSNRLSQRDYAQSSALADETARLNKPSLLDQIFRGIGAVGKTGATAYGAYGRSGGGGSDISSGVGGSSGGPLDLRSGGNPYGADPFAYKPYDYASNWR